MKKIGIILISLLMMFSLTSCGYSAKEWSREISYKDPQTIGGFWNVYFDNGDIYENVKCTYWGIEDDTSVWQLQDGTMLIQSGACHAVQVSLK